MYDLTLLKFIVSYHENSKKYKSIGRDPTHGPYHICGYLPNTHLIYTKEIRESTTYMAS